MKLLLLLFVLATTALHAQGADSLNMTLVGRLDPVSGVGPHASLWGYTAPDGREYALFGSQIGTYVIEVTAAPRIVDFAAGPVNQWREIKTYRQYAYVVTEDIESGGGIQIIDLSTLPDSVSVVRVDNSVVTNVHTIQIDGRYLYAMGTPLGGAVVFDLEPDPTHPRFVGVVSETYFHDAFIRNDTLLGAAIYGGGCEIWDISTITRPRQLGTILYPDNGTHNAELTRDGRYVATSDEIGNTAKTMKVWDIGDMNRITKVAEFTPDPADIIHNVHLIDRYAYVSWYTAGVRVIDMIDPSNPREVGYYDTYPGASGTFSGVWEVYARFSSGKIIASDRQTGLWVFRFNGATAVNLSGAVRDRATGRPIAGASIRLGSGVARLTDSAGRYYGGSARGRQIEVSVSAFGYIAASELITLDGDIARDILLTPSPMATVRITAQDSLQQPIAPFAWSIEPWIPSTPAASEALVTLPVDSLYAAYVGRWGFVPKLVPFTATPGLELRVLLRRRYQDDARLDLGWVYRGFGRVWLSAEHSADRLAPQKQATGTVGHAFATTDVAGRGVSTASRAYEDASMTSPDIDMRDHPQPLVILDLWVKRGNRSATGDAVRVELSNDGGATWKPVTDTIAEDAWTRVRFAPREFMEITDRMKVRVIAVGARGAEPLVAMDNFFVTPAGAASVAVPTRGSAASATIAPNPVGAGGMLEIVMPAGTTIARAELFDSEGRRVTTLDAPASGAMHYRIPAEIAAGWYLLRIFGGDGSEWSRGVVIE